MAQKLVDQTFHTSFVDGQGIGADDYFTYAEDMDTNFVAIRNTVDAMIDELQAIQGPNAVLPLDMMQVNSPDVSAVGSGVIGGHSYFTEINGGDATQLDVKAGQVLTAEGRLTLPASAALFGSGGSGTRWVAVDSAGTPTVAASAGTELIDIASVNWNGSIFTGAVTHLAAVFFDGDDYADQLSVVGSATAGVPVEQLRKAADRFENIERAHRGLETTIDGGAIGPRAIQSGAEGTPSLIAGDGAGVYDTTTGWWRAAADVWAFSASANEVLRLTAGGIEMDPTVGSTTVASIFERSDSDTGVVFLGSNRMALLSAGAIAVDVDSGIVDLPTNSRVRGRRTTAQETANTVAEFVDFDAADDYDNGSWHDHASGTLTDREEFTVPTGHDGGYCLQVNLEWETNANGSRSGRITVDGTEVAGERVQAADGTELTKLSFGTTLALAAGEVLRVEVEQNSTGALDVQAASFAITKVW